VRHELEQVRAWRRLSSIEPPQTAQALNLLKATFVPLEGGRAAAPREFTASFRSPHPKEGALELAVEVDDWGRPRCRRLTVSAPGEGTVSGETLRRIPVARLLGTAMSEAAVTVEDLPGGITQFGPPNQPEYDAISDRFDGAVRKPRQGSPVDDAHLDRVAAEYRRAQGSGAKRHGPDPLSWTL